MKNKKRIQKIQKICKKLEKLWSQVPDQRLGQFLENYVFGHYLERACCIFHFEDDQVEASLSLLERKWRLVCRQAGEGCKSPDGMETP